MLTANRLANESQYYKNLSIVVKEKYKSEGYKNEKTD